MPRRSRYLGKGQIAVCMRSGIKCKASELVRDGRIPSLLVLPEWADPAQPQERPYVPNDLEGAPRFDVSPDDPPVVEPVLSGNWDVVGIRLSWTPAVWAAGPRTDTYRVMRNTGSGYVIIDTVTVEYDEFGEIEGPELTFIDTDFAEGEGTTYKIVALASGNACTSNILLDTFRIITEDFDPIVTEDGDYLVYQGS